MLEFYQNTNIISSHQTILHDEITNSLDCNGPTEVGTIKCEKNYELCEGCGQKIHDRYLMRVADTSWHEHCLSCCLCGVPLNQSCYTRNSKLYCKIDYDRIFGVKCPRCGDRLQSDDMVMRVQRYTFHLACFVCYVCRQPLKKGEQFILRGGQLYCRHDFEKDLYLSQHDCIDDDLIVDDITGIHHPDHHHHHPHHQHNLHHHHHHRSRDGRRGPKRPRTILTSSQRRQFKASFEQSPKPCRKVREGLAKETGLSVRVVQVWFQNQRAKMKKIQRKSKQDGNNNNNNNNGGGNNQNDKSSLSDKDSCQDDKRIKLESPTSDNGLYLSGIGDSYSSSQPLNPNMPYSPDDYQGNSNDSFCSSDISYDGSNFDQLDEATSDSLSLQNVDINSNSTNPITPMLSSQRHDQSQNHNPNQPNNQQHHNNHNHNHHQHHHNNNNHHHHNGQHENGMPGGIQLNTSSIINGINPIDKLYLMQNSYFSNGDHS